MQKLSKLKNILGEVKCQLLKNVLHPRVLALILSSILILSSCGNAQNAIYFNDDTNSRFLMSPNNLEPIIQSNDLLSINVSSVNPEASELFNQQSSSTEKFSGYLVNQEGFLKFPILGMIKAAGQSKKELREEITKMLLERQLLIDPLVDIRFLNFKISILGEVKTPSVITVENEKISLLEALGQVGDITIYGRRDNVTLIREVNGVRLTRKIDLTDKDFFKSPYYYLKSNDIIYVQPNNAKISGASEFKQWIPVVLSAISLAVVTVVTLNR